MGVSAVLSTPDSKKNMYTYVPRGRGHDRAVKKSVPVTWKRPRSRELTRSKVNHFPSAAIRPPHGRRMAKGAAKGAAAFPIRKKKGQGGGHVGRHVAAMWQPRELVHIGVLVHIGGTASYCNKSRSK